MTEELRTRDGDQPLPTRGVEGQEEVGPKVIADVQALRDAGGYSESAASAMILDLQARTQLGAARYGTPLQTHNGRSARLDMYQELLDAAQYARQHLMESPSGVAQTRYWAILRLALITREEDMW